MDRRLLVVDIGNTHVVVGLMLGDRLRRSWRFRTNERLTEDELGKMLHSFVHSVPLPADAAAAMEWTQHDMIISCVVPAFRQAWEALGRKYLARSPLFVGTHLRTDLIFACEQPQRIGQDRIANAVAAHALYGSPAIVVDLGTATTFTVIGRGGRFLGGLIAPGARLAIGSFFSRVRHLPLTEEGAPDEVIGRTTQQALQAGVHYGFLGSLEGILQRLQHSLQVEWGETARVQVLATGGGAQMWARPSDHVDVVDTHLTLHGLRLLYEYNR